MLKTAIKQPFLISLLLASLSLLTACPGQQGQSGNKGVSVQAPPDGPLKPHEEVVAKTWQDVFLQAKNYALGSETIAALESKFSKLAADDLKALGGHKAEDGNGFVSYLVAGKASSQVAAMVEKILDRVDADVLESTLTQKVNGKSVLERLIDAANRPSGEAKADRQKVLGVLVKKKPAELNKLDEALINDLIVDEPKTSKVLLNGLDVPRFMAWALRNRDLSKAAIKRIYEHVNPALKGQIRNDLLEAVYGSPDFDEIFNADPWGLLSGVAVDVYELAKRPAAADKHRGNLLCVLTLRAIDNAALAADRSAYDRPGLRSYSALIKNQIGDVPYEAQATTTACGAALSVKAALDAALTNTYTGFSYLYLNLANPENGLMAAVDEPAVTNTVLAELQRTISADILNFMTLTALSQLNLAGAGADTYLQKLLKRPIDAANPVFNYLDALKAADGQPALDAQFDHQGAAGTADGTALRIVFDPARPPSAPLAELQDWLLKNAAGASIDTLVAAKFLEDFVTRHRAFGRDFEEVYNKVVAGKSIMRDKLLNLTYAAGTAEMETLLEDIDAGLYGLWAGLRTDVYRLRNRADTASFDGTLLFVLTKRAIEDAGAGVAGAYDALKTSALRIKSAINDAPAYHDYATSDTSTGGAQGGETAYSILNQELVTNPVLAADKRYGYPQFYLRLPDAAHPISGFDENLVMSATDQAANVVENLVLSFLYNQAIKTDATGAKQEALAALLGADGDNFINRLMMRPMDYIMNQLISNFLTKYDLRAPVTALLVANGATSGTNPLAKLIVPRAVADLPDNLNISTRILVEFANGDAIRAAADTHDKAAALLNAVHAGGAHSDEMIKVFNHLHKDRMPELGRWSAAHIDADYPDSADPQGSRITLGKIFHDEYLRRGFGAKYRLISWSINEAYDLGHAASGAEGGIDELIKLFGGEFFDEAMISRSDIQPFGAHGNAVYNVTLLYAILDHIVRSGTALSQGMVSGLSAAIKAKISPAAWEPFLTEAARNDVGGVQTSTLAALQVWAGIDEPTARIWLNLP